MGIGVGVNVGADVRVTFAVGTGVTVPVDVASNAYISVGTVGFVGADVMIGMQEVRVMTRRTIMIGLIFSTSFEPIFLARTA